MDYKKSLLALTLLVAACDDDEKKPTPKDSGVPDAAAEAGAPDAGPVVKGPVPYGDHPVLGPSCQGKVGKSKTGPLPTFKRNVLSTQPGAAFVRGADLNADGFPEFLLTTLTEAPDFSSSPPLSAGGAYVVARDGGKPTGTLGTWKTTRVFNKDTTVKVGEEDVTVGWPNSSELVDIDNDGLKDWVIGAGFLTKPRGLIVWMKATEAGKFGKPRAIPVPDPTCWYHVTLPLDMDGDGDEDFVTSCHIGKSVPREPDMTNLGSRVEWAENPGDDTGIFKFHAIGDGGGALIAIHDLDGDGDKDVVAPQYWGPESLVWFEQSEAGGKAWTKHVINNTTGAGFMVRIADMNGDGKDDLVYDNHNNELLADPYRVMGVYWFEIPPAGMIRTLENWDAYRNTVYEGFMVVGDETKGPAAPGVLNVGDVDGDCDIDIAVSGDGDPGLYVFLQQEGKFDKIDLDVNDNNVNSGEQVFADLDGDGDQDLIWGVFGPIPGPGMLEFKSYVAAFLQD